MPKEKARKKASRASDAPKIVPICGFCSDLFLRNLYEPMRKPISTAHKKKAPVITESCQIENASRKFISLSYCGATLVRYAVGLLLPAPYFTKTFLNQIVNMDTKETRSY